MAQRRARKPYNPHTWFQVRARMLCNLGDHHVGPGTWVRQRKDDPRRALSCETCLAVYGIAPPPPVPPREPRPFTFKKHAAADHRARQAGGSE